MQKARNPKLEIRNKSKTPIAETLCTFWTGIWLRLKRDYSDPPRSFSQVDADRGPEVRGGKKGPSAGERGRRFQVSGVRCRERGVEVAGAVGHRVLGTGYFVLDTESQACCAHGSLTRHLTPLFCVPRIPYPASRTPHKKHQRAASDTSKTALGVFPGVGATQSAAPTHSTSFTVKRPWKQSTQKPLPTSVMLRPRREGCAEFPHARHKR